MKRLCFILILALPLLLTACKNEEPYSGHNHNWESFSGYTFPGELRMENVNLDTITPPINPLHPLAPEVEDLPCFYGYLDCALHYGDNKRYCALIGMGEGRILYFLTDDQWHFIRYDSPLLADCRVGEILYIRGYIKTFTNISSRMMLQIKDIERTDSIVTNENIPW